MVNCQSSHFTCFADTHIHTHKLSYQYSTHMCCMHTCTPAPGRVRCNSDDGNIGMHRQAHVCHPLVYENIPACSWSQWCDSFNTTYTAHTRVHAYAHTHTQQHPYTRKHTHTHTAYACTRWSPNCGSLWSDCVPWLRPPLSLGVLSKRVTLRLWCPERCLRTRLSVTTWLWAAVRR
jgi:hypothetical protein